MPSTNSQQRVSDLRALVALAIGRVCDGSESLDVVLDELGLQLPERQRGLFREMVHGAIRWHGAYQTNLKAYLKKAFKPKDRCLLHLLVSACYQLDFMQVAEHAVVNESVVATKALNRVWAKGLINGVLRSVLRDKKTREFALVEQPEGIRQCFPAWFVSELDQHWPVHTNAILKASNQRPPMSLRVNQQTNSRSSYLQRLGEAEIIAVACEQSEQGVTLEKGMPVMALPGFEQGDVSVQDESAQLVAELLQLAPGLRVLDACAAPGGKTAHILEACGDLDEVVALDSEARLGRLYDNMQRLGLKPTVKVADTTKLDSWWDQQLFDRVLLDVPCSGSGVIRRHPDIRYRRAKADIQQFNEQQLALLEAGWQVLKNGGLLLYTTCSILPQENEQLISHFLHQKPDAEVNNLPDFLGLNTGSGRQRLTGVHSGDGFYYALLSKQ